MTYLRETNVLRTRGVCVTDEWPWGEGGRLVEGAWPSEIKKAGVRRAKKNQDTRGANRGNCAKTRRRDAWSPPLAFTADASALSPPAPCPAAPCSALPCAVLSCRAPLSVRLDVRLSMGAYAPYAPVGVFLILYRAAHFHHNHRRWRHASRRQPARLLARLPAPLATGQPARRPARRPVVSQTK